MVRCPNLLMEHGCKPNIAYKLLNFFLMTSTSLVWCALVFTTWPFCSPAFVTFKFHSYAKNCKSVALYHLEAGRCGTSCYWNPHILHLHATSVQDLQIHYRGAEPQNPFSEHLPFLSLRENLTNDARHSIHTVLLPQFCLQSGIIPLKHLNVLAHLCVLFALCIPHLWPNPPPPPPCS